MHLSVRLARGLLALAALAVFVLAPASQASPGYYASPLFGLAATNGTVLVADAGKGIVNADTGELVVALPGVTDLAARGHGRLWAITSGGPEGTFVYSIEGGVPRKVADLWAFEAAANPHPAEIDSNPYDIVDLGGGKALVVDAGGNDLLRVDDRGHVELVAVFPDELVSTANLKRLEGCPDSHSEFCGLPDMMPTEAVPTSVAIGPDGAYYVGELKGFPAPTGESRIWRVDRTAKGVRCGTDAGCTLAFDGGFTSIIDLAFKNGKLYVAQIDDASFWAVESGGSSPGGSVHACDLVSKTCQGVVSGIPMLTAIAFRGSHLWGTVSALIPGQADAVRIA